MRTVTKVFFIDFADLIEIPFNVPRSVYFKPFSIRGTLLDLKNWRHPSGGKTMT